MTNIFRWFFYLTPIVIIIIGAIYSSNFYWDGYYADDFGITFGVSIVTSTIINYFAFIYHSRKYSKTSLFKVIFFLVGLLSLSFFVFECRFLFRLLSEDLFDNVEELINPLIKTLICLMVYIISLGIDRNRDEIILLERDFYYLESKFNRDKIGNKQNSDNR